MIKTTHNQDITLGNETIKILHTPGHSPGGQCFYNAPHLITGDTLFVNGCGRCDLPGSDPEAMFNSLHEIIGKLPDDTIIYSGHNYGDPPTDTLGNQKKTNPYLKLEKEKFLRLRAGQSLC